MRSFLYGVFLFPLKYILKVKVYFFSEKRRLFMELKKVKVKGFKGIDSAEFIPEKVVVLTGENGRGKTSAMSAIRFSLTGELPPDPVRKGEERLETEICFETDPGQLVTLNRTYGLPDVFIINGKNVKPEEFFAAAARYRASYGAEGPTIIACSGLLTDQDTWTALTTGQFPFNGLKELSVQMFDGAVFTLRKGCPSRLTANGKKISQKAANALVSPNSEITELLTSSELMMGLEGSSLGEYLLKVVPATLSFDQLCALSYVSDEEKVVLQPLLPQDNITIADISGAHKVLYEGRRAIGRERKTWFEKSKFEGSLPAEPLQQIQARLDEIKAQKGAVDQIRKQQEQFEDAIRQRDEIIRKIRELEIKANAIQDPDIPPEAFQAVKDRISQYEEQYRRGSVSLANTEKTIALLQKMLDSLHTSECPVCTTLVCTTDKSGCITDLTEAIKANMQTHASILEALGKVKAGLDQLKERLSQMEASAQRCAVRAGYLQKVEGYRESIFQPLVKPPVMPDTSSFAVEVAELEKRLAAWHAFNECEKAKEEFARLDRAYNLYCELLRKSEPKRGILTAVILEYVLDPFAKHANEFLACISSDIRIRFEMADGLEVQVSTRAKGPYLPLKGISTGEKMLVCFALMDMMAASSGTKILMFDNLESMDQKNLEALIDLILQPQIQARYDHIFLSVVKHQDIDDMLARKNGLQVIQM